MKLINLARIDFAGTSGSKAKPEEVFDVQPTTSDQTITPTEGSVFSGGTVRAVTSSIDVNIASNNIKEGVTILGVAGNLKEEKPEESFNVQPTTAEQTITPREGYTFSSGTVHAVTSAIDNNIQPENIKEGVSILGVAGTLSSGGDTPDYRYMNGTVDRAGLKAIGWTDEGILMYEQNILPHYAWQNDQYKVSDENKALYLLDDPTPSSYSNNPNIEYVPKKNMESYFAKPSAFNDMKYIKGIPFYDTSGLTSMYGMFAQCTSLTTIPQLDTSNVTSTERMFFNCASLTTTPPLNLSSATDAMNMFEGCKSLTTIPQLDFSSVTNAMSMFFNCASLTTTPPLNLSSATDVSYMFSQCSSLTTIPQIDLSSVTNASYMFNGCSKLTTIPRLDTSKATNINSIFRYCSKLTIVEGFDFSGLTSSPANLFGYTSDMSTLTHFIVNGKINVSISDNYGIKALTAIDYDSVKSILAAADRTDNTNAKELAFNRTMTDQNGELAALVSSCTSKGWTISGLTLQ